jgi:hypothetical protein
MLIVLLVQSFAGGAHAAAKDERLEVKASETEQLRVLLTNQKVNAVLGDGTRVRGRVREVTPGTVLMNVEGSEGAFAVPRGNQSIATERFNTIEMTSRKGKKRAIFAALFGAAGFLVGAAAIAAEIDSLGGEGGPNGAGTAVLVGATAGGAAAGYALGHHLDKKRLTIVIVK